MQAQYRPQGLFYAVLKGQCYLQVLGSKDLLLLKAGDIVALPTGGNHWICDSPEGRNLDVVSAAKAGRNGDLILLKAGNIEVVPTGIDPGLSATRPDQMSTPEALERDVGDKESTKLLCGILSYDTSIDHPLLKDLPCFIHTGIHDDGDASGIGSLINLVEKESMGLYPGSILMVHRLTEMLILQIFRVHIRQMKYSSGFMAALSDPKIGMALSLIHTETDEHWTVDSLCKTTAMNRTTFTEKFVALVGSTPKLYLTNTRMQKAYNSLKNSNDSILGIAECAGYSSEAAFSKAIKKHFNLTPGQIRNGLK